MKICLLIVFNHRYEKNISFLREYYSSKFSYIRFLIPFADDLEKVHQDVISMHYSSYLFQGYFGEAHIKLRNIHCAAYVAIGDDLLLNPILNEGNVHQMLTISPSDAYTKSLASLYEAPISWSRMRSTYRSFFADGLEWQRLLPTATAAFSKSKAYGIEHNPLGLRNFHPLWCRGGISSLCTAVAWALERNPARFLWRMRCKRVPYPAFYGYSDFIIIPQTAWPAFCNYCSATAAMQLFVESAIPLCMVLACENIETELEYGELFDAVNPKRRLPMKGVELQWQGTAREAFERHYSYQLDKLLREFPEDILYYHPIKLSKWR